MTSKIKDHNPTVQSPRRPWAQMYHDQALYINELINLGKAPDLSLIQDDFNSLTAQAYIRDVIGYLTEEMFEAREVLTEILKNITTNNQIPGLLTDYNEEVADVLSFWGNLFFYLDIPNEKFHEIYRQVAADNQLTYPQVGDYEVDPLYDGIMLAKQMFSRSYNMEVLSMRSFSYQIDQSVHHQVGGHIIGPELVAEYDKGLMETLAQLNIARNNMKIKEWTVKAKESNYNLVVDSIVKAFLNYQYCLVSMSHRETMVAKTFLSKSIIKFERLEEN